MNTLNNRSAGQTILDTFFNDIHQAMNGDLVGRNTSGVPEAGQNLGTVALPWGNVRADSIIIGGSSIDTSQVQAPVDRVVSGKKRSGSNQPQYISPNGAAASFIIDGNPVNLVLDIGGLAVSVTTDLTKSSLTLAPSVQNTCLVNDTDAAGQDSTRTWGEENAEKDYITIDTAGTEITSRIGQFATFRVNGEYFLAFIESATRLSKCYRGYFYDDTFAPVNRTQISNNDSIAIMSTAWIFIENNATTVDVTYRPPVYSFSSPASPQTGDYWRDLGNAVWKRYDGASFQIVPRTFVGIAVQDTTACVAARSLDFYKTFKAENTLNMKKSTTEIMQAKTPHSRLSVMGVQIEFKEFAPSWNITTDLAGAEDMYAPTEQADTMYYLYVKDTGQAIISDMEPYRRHDLFGLYHPHNPWRCVGVFYNDVSSDIECGGAVIGGVRTLAHVAGAFSVGNTNNDPIAWDTVDEDTHGALTELGTTSAKYRALFNGIYQFDEHLDQSTGGRVILMLYVNGVERYRHENGVGAPQTSLAFNPRAKLKAGDYVQFVFGNQTGATYSYNGGGGFIDSAFAAFRLPDDFIQ